MTVYIISGIVVSGLMLIIFLLLSACSNALARYRAELEDLCSAKRRAEQAAVKAQMGERAAVAELRHLRALQQKPAEELSVSLPTDPVRRSTPAPKQPVRSPSYQSSRVASVRHSGAPVTSSEDISPITAALVVHTMAATHSYGDYSDSYSDSCGSSDSSCGGGCDSGGCGGD